MGYKICPQCGERLKKFTKKCPKCGVLLDKTIAPVFMGIIAAGILLALAIIGLMLF